jgi:carboxymethylenebutenolidase
MDWMLPGIQPTGKRVEVAMLAVVQFEGDKLAHEHLYWDQASVLVQLGLLQRAGLPVVGAEGARSVLDRKIPLNELLYRAELLHRAKATPRRMPADLPTPTERSSSNSAPRGTDAQGVRRGG